MSVQILVWRSNHVSKYLKKKKLKKPKQHVAHYRTHRFLRKLQDKRNKAHSVLPQIVCILYLYIFFRGGWQRRQYSICIKTQFTWYVNISFKSPPNVSLFYCLSTLPRATHKKQYLLQYLLLVVCSNSLQWTCLCGPDKVLWGLTTITTILDK